MMKTQTAASRRSNSEEPPVWLEGVKVFSVTKFTDRVTLGDVITTWLASQRTIVVDDVKVTQSSDAEFHCLSITILYRQSST